MRAAQIAILAVSLALWELLPREQIINPLFTSYPSAIWPTFLDMLKATPQQASILTHTWSTVAATVVGFSAAMLVGTATAAALWWSNTLYKVLDPYLVVANALPKTAFVPIFYIWLGASLSIYGMSLAISLFITVLMIYSGFQGIDPNKVKLAQTLGASKAANSDQSRLAGKRSDALCDTEGQRRPVPGRRHRRRISVGQQGARLSHSVRQPDISNEHRDDLSHYTRDCLIADVSRDLVVGIRRHAPPLRSASGRLARFGRHQPRKDLVRGQHVAEEHQEVVQRGCVLRVGKGSVAIGHHDDAIIEHHGVACSGLAAYVGRRAGDEQRLRCRGFSIGRRYPTSQE